MNELEQRLHYPLGDQLPDPGTTLEVAPGVYWIRMGLPFALNHINLWLLRDAADGREGWTVVDCCVDRPEGRAQWEQLFAHALQGLPILRVIVTHMHPDHIGLAHWLCARWQAPLWISGTDYNVAKLACLRHNDATGGESGARFFALHGLTDPDALRQIRARNTYYPSLVPAVPDQYHRLLDNQLVHIGSGAARHAWRCISGYGHAPEHMALYCEALGLLIGGDMMLPRISTNVSVFEFEPEADPLTLFLQSIDKFAPLPADTLTLPSHGKPFRGLHERIRQLHQHHADRLADVLLACRQKPHSAAEVLPVLFTRALDLHQTTFAMGEAIAHLHTLWFGGQLTRSLGADGILRFAATD